MPKIFDEGISDVKSQIGLELDATALDSIALGAPFTLTGNPRPTSKIEILPNEVLSNIFEYLDNPKPSDSGLYDEPTFSLTHSESADLKAISCVSKRWRHETLTMLFKYARYIVPESKTQTALSTQMEPIFGFIRRHSLQKVITTFALVVHDSKATDRPRKKYHLDEFSDFWCSLFNAIDPAEILVIAPASTLGALTACQVEVQDARFFDCPCHYLRLQHIASLVDTSTATDLSVDSVSDIEKPPVLGTERNPGNSIPLNTPSKFKIQIHQESGLSLSGYIVSSSGPQSSPSGDQAPSSAQASSSKDGPLETMYLHQDRSSTLFDARPWTSLLLNEGSSIRAYATHEFWLKQPPSILQDLVGSVESDRTPLITPTIRDMEYISVFPMSGHVSKLAMNLPRLDRIYVQLVPRNNILEMPDRMVMVDSENLWMERNGCYANIVRELFNAPPVRNYKYLQIFESGDAADRDAWLMAVEYIKRAENGWRIAGDGVFVRDVEDLPPENPGDDDEGNLPFEGALIRWAWRGTTKLPVSAFPLYEQPLGPMS